MPWIAENDEHLDRNRVLDLLKSGMQHARQEICTAPRRVLLLPPDITRMHSGAGWITEYLYQLFADEAEVFVIPTLGQHEPHTLEQNQAMFGSIPESQILAHDWIDGCVEVGSIEAERIKQTSNGVADWDMPIWLSRRLMKDPWDLIINVGHVVPHEVLGFANHNKNYFIGLGGKPTICASHMMAARCGIENNLGTLVTPVRECFNEAEERYLGHLPDLYVQVVMARNEAGDLVHTGLYIGDDLATYLDAARQSREQNITVLDEPLDKVVCVMQGDEFFSTWVANKAVYRTRMALADDGELLIIAPGLKRFGEQADVDQLIRKYGYSGTKQVMKHFGRRKDLQDLAHAAAHLIHGSSEGRFKITYAPGHLSRDEIEGVNFQYADLSEMLERYPIDQLREGMQEHNGESFFFIPTPSAGLWATREKLGQRLPQATAP